MRELAEDLRVGRGGAGDPAVAVGRAVAVGDIHVVALVVGRKRADAKLAGQLEHVGLGRTDERGAAL